MDRMEEAVETLAGWKASGELHMELEVRDGIDNCLGAFHSLFGGSNRGKLVMRLNESGEPGCLS
jgi:NADPH-dependent curcumin reductase CurA